jgi:Zn-dependent protease with chaperone function
MPGPTKHIVQGDYYDGQTSVRYPVSMIFAGGKLKVIGTKVDLEFDLRRVRRSLRVADTPRWLYLPGGGACVTADNDAVDVIKRIVRYDQVLHQWESRPAIAAVAVLLVFAFVFALVYRGLPALAEEIAYRIPVEAETLLGQQALQGLDSWILQPSALPHGRQQELREKFSAMTRAAGDETPYRLEFRASRIGPNAFALPSGIIVLLDDLVKLARRDEEVLGVLAHELGHVHNRHTMRMLLESSATALVIAGLTGDIASTTSLAAGAPALLLQTKYSRDNEREADAYAVELMKKASVDPGALARILARLDGGAGKKKRRGPLPTFLSTHPATDERKALALAAGKAEPREEEEQKVAIPEPRLQPVDPVQREIVVLIGKRDYEGLEARLAGVQQRYEQSAIGEEELETAFRAFRRVGAAAEPALTEWSGKMPKSYAAHTALGIYYLWRGIAARGSAYARDTTDEQMQAMQTLLGKARTELEGSLALTAKPHISHLSLITLSRYVGDGSLGVRHFREGLKVSPQSVSLRLARMTTVEPRWRGSYREMEALARDAAVELKDPAAAGRVASRVPAYRAWEKQRERGFAEALQLYDEAIRLDERASNARCERSWVLSELGRHEEAYLAAREGLMRDREAGYCVERVAWTVQYAKDRDEVVAMTSLVIAIDPGVAQAYNQRGWAQQGLGRSKEAFEDYLASARLGDEWGELMAGKAFHAGVGVPRNPTEGTEWLRKSAAQGNAEAKRMLDAADRK